MLIALLSGAAAIVSGPAPVKAAVTAHSAQVAHTRVVQQARETKAQRSAAPATTSACSGAISPDTMYSCTSPSSTGTDTFTITVNQVPNDLMIRAQGSGSENPVAVTTPDGSRIACSGSCQVNQAGTYSVAVTNYDAHYTLEYSELLSESNCPAVNSSFSASVTSGSLAAGQDGACYSLGMSSGDVLHSNISSANALRLTVYDSTGAQVCSVGSSNGSHANDCTLSGTAPYRAWMTADSSGIAGTYQMQLYDITNPSGCQATAQMTYGQVPAQSTDPCRTLTVTKADRYYIAVDPAGSPNTSGPTLYNQDGTRTCTSGTNACQLAVGTYDLVQDNLSNPSFAVTFMAVDETRGCTSTGDTGFSSGPATGTIASKYEEECLTLPDASGQSVYVFNEPSSAGAATPYLSVVDATGTDQQCAAGGSCPLTGTAPFRVILTAGASNESYKVLVQNTATVSCPTWAQSAYGSSSGATVTLTATDTVKCLTIPAAQHASVEKNSQAVTSGSGQVSVGVYDSSGKEICGTPSTIAATCSYQSGQSYTALVQDSSAATVNVARRDITQTATCKTPASTTVGGPATQFTLNSGVDAECYRITPAATDKLMAQYSTIGPSQNASSGFDSADMLVTDASGTVICQESCKLTGDTDYQIILLPSGYDNVATRVALNVWTLETANGLASQCTANSQLTAADGWQASGNLTDSATGYCAEVKIQPSQKFGFFHVSSGPSASVSVPSADIYVPEDWSGSGSLSGLCGSMNAGAGAEQCDTSSSETSDTAIVVVNSGSAALGGFTLQGVCWSGGCTQSAPTPALKSISPASAAAGPDHTVTVTGTGLNLGDRIVLTDSTGNGTSATTRDLSVNPAGTSLTVSLNTSDLSAGKYGVGLVPPVVDESTGVTSSLPNAYTVTSAPALSGFTPVTQTQIASTSLAKGSTTNVGVGGHGGVPSSGATSAKLEITVTNPSTAGSITVYPGSESKPSTTTLNFAAGQTQTSMVDVQLGSGVEVYNGAGGSLNVKVDTVGYYSSGGSKYTPLSQGRILNSTSVASKTTKEIQIGGHGGVPSSGASSVALEVTETGSAAAGSAVVYPNGSTRPADADLSFAKGQSVTDLVIGKLGTGLVLYNNSGGAANFTVDVVGYYSSSGSKFHTLGPTRILDTRNAIGGNGNQGVPSQAAAVTHVTDIAGIPRNATAVVMEVTVLSPQDAGSLAAFGDGNGAPFGQSLAFAAGSGQKATAQVVVPVVNGSTGDIDFCNDSGGSIQIVGDLEGYYA